MEEDLDLRQRSPDSSSSGDSRISCPRCPAIMTEEASLANHLLVEHRMQLVVKPQLNSTASSVSTSPRSEGSPCSKTSTTNCPVCRKQVEDLSLHFVQAHSGPKGVKLEPGEARLAPIVLPNQPIPASDLQQKLMNLKQEIPVSNYHNTLLGKRKTKGRKESHSEAINLSVKDQDNNNQSEEENGKRRRKQTSVPEQNKDQRYWARRLKNNEAAKRSRDMRIQREKLIFDENARLESSNQSLIKDKERLTTENKELQLKMQFILEENERLKAIIRSLESQDNSPAST